MQNATLGSKGKQKCFLQEFQFYLNTDKTHLSQKQGGDILY